MQPCHAGAPVSAQPDALSPVTHRIVTPCTIFVLGLQPIPALVACHTLRSAERRQGAGLISARTATVGVSTTPILSDGPSLEP